MASQDITRKSATLPEKAERAEAAPVFVPNVDVRESAGEFIVEADMPGVDENSVTVNLERNVLALHGSFQPKAPEGYRLTYQEYDSGNYERTFTLGEQVAREGIRASVKDGVLRVVLPKAKEAQPRRIEVRAG
ncbi:MAG: Spore protein SP21 [Lentisphaerae bacterium ADurb.BinA184]|nr:MAG: Spore protein SP21 [Lentisphaerae bacterium ADurb.BinA184]